jgi:methionyl-tRNA formyltransferase
MKIIFAGTPKNAASCLRALLDSGLEVVGVLTKEDASVGRSSHLSLSAVAAVAEANGISLLKANRVDETVRSWMKSLNADLGLIVAYGCILKKPDLLIPRLGWMNLHYSLLPNLPGPAPVQHALMAGFKSTGVSLFMLDEGIDSGPIVAAREISIEPHENSAELLERLTNVGNQLLLEVLENAEVLITNAIPQPSGASFAVAVKPSRASARIDFSKNAVDVHNLIRAMNPEPTAWLEHNSQAIRVLESVLIHSHDLEVGTAAIQNKKLLVGCKDGAVELLQVQPAGKNPMPGADWFRGLRVEELSFR